MSRDMAGGYGPEFYTLKQATPGNYSIAVKVFTPKIYQPYAQTTPLPRVPKLV